MKMNRVITTHLSSPQGQHPSLCLLIIKDQGRAGAVDLWITEDTESLKGSSDHEQIL